MADSVASQGVAKSTTWLVAAASDADAARAFGPARFTNSDISGEAEFREANATVWPLWAHRVPSVPPTFPDPMIAMFMYLGMRKERRALLLFFLFVEPVHNLVRWEYEHRDGRDHQQEHEKQNDQ